MKSILLVLFTFYLFQVHADEAIPQWKTIEHTVKKDETLRLIARHYFGAKQAVYCLQDQLNLNDSDELRPGQKLMFMVPNKKWELDDFMKLPLKCFPKGIVFAGERHPKADRGVAAEGEISEPAPEPFDPDSLRARGWGKFVFLGSGIAYGKIQQKVDGRYRGDVNFESFDPANVTLRGLYAWSPSFAIEGGFSEIQGHSLQDRQLANPKYHWDTYDLANIYYPKALRFSGFGSAFHPQFRVGLSHEDIPFFKPISSSQAVVESGSVEMATLGVGMSVIFTELWFGEMALNGEMPIAKRGFTDFKNNSSIQGFARLQRVFGNGWLGGFNWHGQTQDADVTYVSSGSSFTGTSKFFNSSFELSLGQKF